MKPVILSAFILLITISVNAQNWLTTGNSSTIPGTNFIGTTDNKNFIFKTKSIERGRLLASGKWRFGTLSDYALIDTNGTLSFVGTSNYKVAGNKYVFQYVASPNYGLFFNSTALQYEFRNGSAVPVFYVNANTGNSVFNGTLKVGSYTLPATDGTNGQVLKTNGSGALTWSADNGTAYTAGTGISISGTTITNSSPDQTVSLTSGSGINVTGAYPNFTIASTSGTSQWTTSGSNIYYNTGNVGVGTSSPSARLSVLTSNNNVAKFDGGAPMYVSLYETGIYRGYIGSFSGSAEDVDFGTGSSNTKGSVHLTIQASPKMTLTAAGNIGIGTTTPSAKLHVAGNAIVDGALSVGSIGSPLNVSGASSSVILSASNITHNTWTYSNDGYYSYVSLSSSLGSGIIANFGVPSEANQFTVWGNIIANNYNVTSDKKLKTNIKPLSQDLSAIDIIKKLNPVDYDFKTDEYKAMNLPKIKQFGFVAQEIQQLLPNLVSKAKYPLSHDGKGNVVSEEVLTVNYVGIIPVLTQAIKEQQKIIDTKEDELKQQQKINDDQQKQIDELRTMVLQLQQNSAFAVQSNNRSSVVLANTATLAQNIPNPFANTTVINYTLPQKFSSAQIIITDKNGNVLKQVNLSGNKGKIQVDASTLSSGAYQYSLYVDARLIDTKQMVLAK